MTQLLEKALDQVSKLSSEQQDAIAAVILEELEDDQQWTSAFAASGEALTKIANKVRADIKAGRSKPLGMDEL